MIEDEVFVGHGVMFVNDKRPRATTARGRAAGEDGLGAAPTIASAGVRASARARSCSVG